MDISLNNTNSLYTSFTDKIKKSSLYVYENSESVKINEKKLKDFVMNLNDSYFSEDIFLNYFNNHLSNIKNHNLIKYEELIAYVCVVDSLNFCFWPLEKEYNEMNKNKINFEYDDYVNNLNKIYEEDKSFFTAKKLSKINIIELKESVFSNLNFPLLEERTRSLNELGNFIESKHNGLFANFLKECGYDCELIAERISEGVTTFRDESIFKGRQIFIYKRAQILAADLSTAIKCFNNQEKKNLVNVDKLTMFADYRIPQILRHYGIIEYEKGLEEKINSRIEMEPNSIQEIEIRCLTIHCVEIIKTLYLELKGIKVTSVDIDYTLWNMGELVRYQIQPHHRVTTIFY